MPIPPTPASVAAAAATRAAHAHPAIGGAVQQLESVAGLDIDAHPDAFARVHAELQRALADLDSA